MLRLLACDAAIIYDGTLEQKLSFSLERTIKSSSSAFLSFCRLISEEKTSSLFWIYFVLPFFLFLQCISRYISPFLFLIFFNENLLSGPVKLFFIFLTFQPYFIHSPIFQIQGEPCTSWGAHMGSQFVMKSDCRQAMRLFENFLKIFETFFKDFWDLFRDF